MYLGRIVEQGSVEEILLNPRHPYTKALLSVASNADREHPALIPGEPPDPTAIPRGCRFHPRCPRRRQLADEGIDVSLCTSRDVALSTIGAAEVACFFAEEQSDKVATALSRRAAPASPGPD